MTATAYLEPANFLEQGYAMPRSVVLFVIDGLRPDGLQRAETPHIDQLIAGGGHAQTHGTEIDQDMTIPWIACGPGVPAGHALETPVSIIDNPPTIATALGVEPAKDWAGKVIGEIMGA